MIPAIKPEFYIYIIMIIILLGSRNFLTHRTVDQAQKKTRQEIKIKTSIRTKPLESVVANVQNQCWPLLSPLPLCLTLPTTSLIFFSSSTAAAAACPHHTDHYFFLLFFYKPYFWPLPPPPTHNFLRANRFLLLLAIDHCSLFDQVFNIYIHWKQGQSGWPFKGRNKDLSRLIKRIDFLFFFFFKSFWFRRKFILFRKICQRCINFFWWYCIWLEILWN